MKAWWKPREERRRILVPARMRDGAGWHDVTICNASSRGLMVNADPPPRPGSFVELRRGEICIVGQVKWASDISFGLRTQDKIDVHALCTSGKASTPPSLSNDRRSAKRTAEKPRDLAHAAEMSRLFGRIFDYAIVASAVVAVAIALSQIAMMALKAPLAKASAAMATAGLQ